MSIEFSKAFLMSGKNFNLTPTLTLRHPTIQDILSINSSTSPDIIYWIYVQILLSDPYENMVMLDDIDKNYLETTPYDVFILQWKNCVKAYRENKDFYDSQGTTPLDNILNAFQFFIIEKHCFKEGIYEDGTTCFYDINDHSCQINEKIFEYICSWVKAVNRIDYSNRINPADENARRVLIDDMRDEIKKSKKTKKKQFNNFNYLGSIMSAASFCTNGAINPFNINECKIYWLNESLAINNKKDYVNHLLDGVYHGTISSKNINKKEFEWME